MARKWTKRLCLVLALVFCAASLTLYAGAASGIYLDTASHWCREPIRFWTEKNVVQGVGFGLFKPDDEISRADTSVVMGRFLRLTEQSGQPFPDVSTGKYYTGYIAACNTFGLVTGLPDGTFDPMGTLTREQAMVIVCRALCLEPEEDTSDLARLFPDPETVSAWAAPYVTALVHHDIVHGTIVPGGVPLLEGQRICTRAMLVEMLRQFVGLYINEPGIYDISQIPDGKLIVVTVPGVILTGRNEESGVLITEGASGADMDFNGAAVGGGIAVRGSDVDLKRVGCGTEIRTADTAGDNTVVNGVTLPAGSDYIVPCGKGQCYPGCVCDEGKHCGCGGSSGGSGGKDEPEEPEDLGSLRWWNDIEGIPFGQEDQSETYLLPGDSVRRVYRLAASSRKGGTVYFTSAITQDSAAPSLADKLNCKIWVTGSTAASDGLDGALIYDGPLSGATASVDIQSGKIALTYTFQVTLPTDANLNYQTLTAGADFGWRLEVRR